eukprot:3494277-Amphidinium_carterae.1
MSKPLMKHARDLNLLVRWLKRKPIAMQFKALEDQSTLWCLADSAFQAREHDGLAVKACVLLLGGSKPGGPVQIVDWYSRKQTHVCRSTYAAELHALSDGRSFLLHTAGLLLLHTAGLLHEVLHGHVGPEECSKRVETGGWGFRLALATDA